MKKTVTLRNDPADAKRLTAFATAFADRHGLPSDERSRLLVVLDELFANVVSYGYDGETVGTIVVALSLSSGRIEIDFSDDGEPFDPLSRTTPDLQAGTDDRPIGGLGILIVRSLCDEARYQREGARNRLFLARRLVPPKPP